MRDPQHAGMFDEGVSVDQKVPECDNLVNSGNTASQSGIVFCKLIQRLADDFELSLDGRVNLKAAVGSEFSFRLRAASIPGCVSLVSDAEERARDGL